MEDSEDLPEEDGADVPSEEELLEESSAHLIKYSKTAAGTNEEQSVCEPAEMKKALGQMHGHCAIALQSEEALSSFQRCLCYMQVDSEVAENLQCKAHAFNTMTLAEEYAICEAEAASFVEEHHICSHTQLFPMMKKMDEGCQDRMYEALLTGSTPSQLDRCGCFEQLDEESAMQLTCHALPRTAHTVAQEYKSCSAQKVPISRV